MHHYVNVCNVYMNYFHCLLVIFLLYYIVMWLCDLAYCMITTETWPPFPQWCVGEWWSCVPGVFLVSSSHSAGPLVSPLASVHPSVPLCYPGVYPFSPWHLPLRDAGGMRLLDPGHGDPWHSLAPWLHGHPRAVLFFASIRPPPATV